MTSVLVHGYYAGPQWTPAGAETPPGRGRLVGVDVSQRTCVCPVCKANFTTEHSRKVYCSHPCTVVGNNAKQRSRSRKRYEPRLCPRCGAPYVPVRSDSEYCSKQCARRARYVPQVKPDHSKTCRHCRRSFSAKRSDAQFCGETCIYRYHAGVPVVRTCEVCNQDIANRSANARFCVSCYADRAKGKHRTFPAVCEHCGGDFFAQTATQRYCGASCGGAAERKAQLTLTLTRECRACGDVYQTSDVRVVTCSTACRSWINNHPGVRRQFDQKCPTCHAIFRTSRMSQMYCSTRCVGAAGRRRNRSVAAPYVLATNCLACGTAMPPKKKTGSRFCGAYCRDRYRRAPDRFAERFGRTCERCGITIGDDARINKRFCTTSCQVSFNQEHRRARRRGLPVERISRAEIFVRDEMVCHLCGMAIENSPTLDHVIPISHPLCPGHVWENVAAAHARCNISKRDRVRPADFDLYERLREQRQTREVLANA